MNKLYLLVFSLFVTVSVVTADVDSALLEKMQQNPAERQHVIVFFQERLQPEQVMAEMNVQGDKTTNLRQLAQTFKAKTEEQAHWLIQSYQDKIKKLFVHDLVQAISFEADAETIQAVANEPQAGHVCLFNEEKLKPHDCFLTRDYSQFRAKKLQKINSAGTPEPVTIGPLPRNRFESSRDVSIDEIINTLKKIFDFIEENQPVVNTSVDMASAIPKGIASWQEMTGWVKTKSNQYVLEYENGFGVTVVKFVYTIHFYYNGNYQGQGRYITCATVSIDELSVLWGYTVNANVSIPDSGILNIGTSTSPVASMQLFVNWEVKTIIKHEKGTAAYNINGRGAVSED